MAVERMHSESDWDELEPEIQIGGGGKVEEREIADSDLVGERFGKYLIVGELAKGGMAEIFLGVHRGLEGFLKVAVIKRVLSQFSDNDEFVQMFIDEARLAARLDHPNIVRTYEFGEVGGHYFTTMEYLAGEDLSKALQKLSFSNQPLPLHIAAGILAQVCAGLHFAHQLTDTAGRPLNLVHRDVNPANVIITYGGEVKIIDFGVAKTDANKTLNGTIKGKVAYMSPEQLVARGVDRRSDVFSAGVVLWEALTGRALFLRDNEGATLYAIMNDPIRPPSRYRPEVPPALDEIVMRALSRTPADRYDTAEEMADALEKFLTTQPKYDARVLARMLEELFGPRRAEAKRSIAQTRSLGRNISLVMKMRTEVRSDLLERFDELTGDGQLPAVNLPERDSPLRRWLAIGMAAVIVAAIAGGVIYAMYGSGGTPSASASANPAAATAGATLQLASEPPGAAISIDGEPTGKKTPATFTGLVARPIVVQLEHPDHGTTSQQLDLSAGGTVARTIAFEAGGEAAGRLVIAGLPRDAVIVVNGEEHAAGTVIDVAAGTHDVRVVVDGRTLVEQKIETAAGDQRWKLVGGALVRGGT